MGKHLVTIKQVQKERELAALSPSERRAFERTQAEAEAAGATMGHDGVGGVPASLALGVFRRDGYQCKRCGTRENIELHHKGGIENSKDARKGKIERLAAYEYPPRST